MSLFLSKQIRPGMNFLTSRTSIRLFSSTNKDQVGFIGLGIMGNGMVRNLLKNDIPVLVWNRSAEKCVDLQNEFGY